MGKVSTTRFPDPPKEYDPEYLSQLVDTIEKLVAEVNATNKLFATTANFSNLPTSATGLRVGDVWVDVVTLKVVV